MDKDLVTIQELLIEIAVLKTKIDASDKALLKQASEYERRLDSLNHAHAESQRVLNTYLPREIFEKSQALEMIWRAKTDNELSQNRGRDNTFAAFGAIALSLTALATSIWNALH